MQTRVRYQVMVVLVVFVSMIAACGTGSPSSTVPPAESQGSPAPANPATTPAPAELPEIVVGLGGDSGTLDPRQSATGQGYSIGTTMFEPLVFRTADMALYGVLAESWAYLDSITIQFKLRRGITFHNGEPFTADSVKYTIESQLDPNFKTILRLFVKDIDHVDVVDTYTANVVLKYPSRGALRELANVPIVPAKTAQELGDAFATNPIGTGPYKFVSYVPNGEVVVEAYDEYWGEKPHFQKITFKIIPEAATRVAALESGDVLLIDNVAPDAIERLRKNPKLDVVQGNSMRVVYYGVWHDRPPFSDPRVRRALAHAIDVQTIVDTVLGGLTTPATQFLGQGNVGRNETLQPVPFDPTEAKRLLAEAGYGDGFTVNLGSSQGRFTMDKEVNEAVAGYLRDIGLTVNVESLPMASYRPKSLDGSYDMFYTGLTSLTGHPNTIVPDWFKTGSKLLNYSNPVVDELMTVGNQTMDDNESEQAYQEIMRIFSEETAIILLFHEPQLVAFDKRLKGYVSRPDDYIIIGDYRLEP